MINTQDNFINWIEIMNTLTNYQTIIVKQVLTNLDHIVNARFDEVEGFVPCHGLCDNVLYPFNGIDWDFIDIMFTKWENFSGCKVYPVLPMRDYDYYVINNLSQYDLATENGRLRIDLAKHCIQYIKSYFNIEG